MEGSERWQGSAGRKGATNSEWDYGADDDAVGDT